MGAIRLNESQGQTFCIMITERQTFCIMITERQTFCIMITEITIWMVRCGPGEEKKWQFLAVADELCDHQMT